MNHLKLKAAITGLLLISLSSAQAARPGMVKASQGNSFWAEAQVLHAEPVYRIVNIVTPQEVCREERIWQANNGHRSHTPTIAGGIIGGVVGNQFGSGRGRDLMTVAGALLGASVSADASRQRQQQVSGGYYNVQQHCVIEHVSYAEERLDGYQVTYRYAGQDFVTQTAVAPGRTMRVRVQVEPLPYNTGSR